MTNESVSVCRSAGSASEILSQQNFVQSMTRRFLPDGDPQCMSPPPQPRIVTTSGPPVTFFGNVPARSFNPRRNPVLSPWHAPC